MEVTSKSGTKKKWKWIILGLVGLVLLYALLANLDARGGARTCVKAELLDAEGRRLGYTEADGKSQTWEFPDQGKLVGLQPGEQIGFSFVRGRLSGMLYDVRCYLLDKEQGGRVKEFSIRRIGTGSHRRASPELQALPLGCPG